MRSLNRVFRIQTQPTSPMTAPSELQGGFADALRVCSTA